MGTIQPVYITSVSTTIDEDVNIVGQHRGYNREGESTPIGVDVGPKAVSTMRTKTTSDTVRSADNG